MNITKFTQKSIEAVQNMEKVAYDYGNQMIDQEHFLYALISQDDSLIAKLLTKMGIQLPAFTSSIERIMEANPKVQGGSPYVSQDLNNVLMGAEDEAKAMGDLSENFEYKSALEEKDLVNSRLKEINELLDNVEIIDSIDEKDSNKKKVGF